MTNIMLTCGPCGNVLCSQYGCQKKRFELQPFYVPSPEYINVNERIAELERRIAALEGK